MFWTIVGALLFVFVGIPIILMVLGWLGVGSISLLSHWADKRNQRKNEVVSMTREQEAELSRRTNRTRWLIVGGGILIVLIAVIGLSLSNSSSHVNNYTVPTTNVNAINTYQEQLNKNAELEKQRYYDYAEKIAEKYPDKKISTQDQLYITNNLPYGVNFIKLKPLLISQGFEFTRYEGINTIQSEDHSKEVEEIVKNLKSEYSDLQINYSEEFAIRRNIPSYIQFNDVKDEMLKQGFKFQ